MTKTVYFYENLKERTSVVGMSLVQMSELTGVGYRTLQRHFSKRSMYGDSGCEFRVVKTEFVQDGRKNNRGKFK